MLASHTVLWCISTTAFILVAGETSFRVPPTQFRQLPKRVFCNYDGCYSKRASSSPPLDTLDTLDTLGQWLALRRLALGATRDPLPSAVLRPELNPLSSTPNASAEDGEENADDRTQGSSTFNESNESLRTNFDKQRRGPSIAWRLVRDV